MKHFKKDFFPFTCELVLIAYWLWSLEKFPIVGFFVIFFIYLCNSFDSLNLKKSSWLLDTLNLLLVVPYFVINGIPFFASPNLIHWN